MHFSKLQAAQFAHHVTKDHTHKAATPEVAATLALDNWFSTTERMNVSACFALKAFRPCLLTLKGHMLS